MTLAPASFNKTWVQGATLSYEFQLTSGGSPVDITGYTGRAQVRDKVADDPASVVVVASTANRIVFNDPANGKFKVEFTEAESESVDSTVYSQLFCDPELIAPSGDVEKHLVIVFSMKAEYTR